MGIGIRKANENEEIRQSPALFETTGRHFSELFDKHQLKPEVYNEVAQKLFK